MHPSENDWRHNTCIGVLMGSKDFLAQKHNILGLRVGPSKQCLILNAQFNNVPK